LKFSQQFVFDGTNNYFYGALPKVFDKYFSISLWIKTTSTNAVIVSYGRSPSYFNGQFELTVANGYLNFWDYKNGYGFDVKSTVKVNTGIRLNAILVKNSTSCYLYINGALSGSQTIAAGNLKSYYNIFNLGNDPRNLNNYLIGTIDSLMLFDYSLTQTQVNIIVTDFLNPPTIAPTNSPSQYPTNPTFVPTTAPTQAPSIRPPTVSILVGGEDVSPTLGFLSINSLISSDATYVQGSELRSGIATMIAKSESIRSSIVAAVFSNGDSKITNVTWDLTHDSIFLAITDTMNTYPVLLSNHDYGYYPDPSAAPRVLIAAGFLPGTAARFTCFGKNPFADPIKVSGTRILKNVFTWLNNGVDPSTISGFNFTTAQIQGQSSYWYSDDIPTRKWLVGVYPNARVNNINTCDNIALLSCLKHTNILIIGNQMNTVHDTAVIYASTNVTQVNEAVINFLKAGGAVLYVHDTYDGNDLSLALLTTFGIQQPYYYGNYFRASGALLNNPFDVSSTSASIYSSLLNTLNGVTPLNSTDLGTCW